MRRVALVHDWLTGMRGGEKALEVLCELFPDADVFTLFYLPARISPVVNRHTVKASVLNLLNTLDVPPKQVEITAKIFEVSRDFDFQQGTELVPG